MTRLTHWLLLTVGTLALVARAAEDERPVVDAAKVAVEKVRDHALPTLFLVGDSTVKSGGVKGLVGWGERLTPWFDTNRINVINRAIGGRSARTYFAEGRWDAVAGELKPGDYVIIQFGHNDQGRIGDPANKNRADGKGTGEEVVEDVKPDGTKEMVHTFGWYLNHFAASAKAKGATVVICAPIPHKDRWENGRDFADLAGWDREVAQKNGVQFLDLTLAVTATYQKLGAPAVAPLFADKGTHTSDAGARTNALCVVAGLRGLPGAPLDAYLSAAGRTVAAWSPTP